MEDTLLGPSQLYRSLCDHRLLASSLLLLKSYELDKTLAVYPVSTLAVNHNLVVQEGLIYSNVRRVTGGDEVVWVICVEALGANERDVVKSAVEQARVLVGGRPKSSPANDFFDGLGICTWESFGGSSRRPDRPTVDLLLSLVPPEPVRHFLIDDGWQDVSPSRRLRSFRPWHGMGASMGEVVDRLKARGIEEVGVWVTLQGYWLSIDPDGELSDTYECQRFKTAKRGVRGGVVELEPDPQQEDQWLPAAAKAEAFWSDWFGLMKTWGLSFVKVDNQAHYDQVVGPGAAHTQQAMWSGMLAAAERVWGSTDRVIMCMSHNERMLNGPGGLDCARPPGNLVFRNSDDFNMQYPMTHADFVCWNTYQAILTGQLSLTPDFDMFMSATSHWPIYHTLLRALAPGPLLVSDTPDEPSDPSILSRLIGTDWHGRQRAVKASRAATVLPHRWFWDNVQGRHDGPALVASVAVPEAHGALIGMWHARDPVSGCWAKDSLGRRDVEEALGVERLDGEWAVWSAGLSKHNRGKVAIASAEWDGRLHFDLEASECECVVIARILNVASDKVAVLGLVDKLAPLCGVEAIDVANSELCSNKLSNQQTASQSKRNFRKRQ